MTLHQRQPSPPDEADLEITAELPVLDVAAYEASTTSSTAVVPAQVEAANAAPHGKERGSDSTDAWMIPTQTSRGPADVPNTVIDENRARLEINLQSLATTLREVEERLTRKGERLAEIEKALDVVTAEREATAQRAQALIAEMEQARVAATESHSRITELQRALKDQEVATESGHLRESDLKSQLEQGQAMFQSQLAGTIRDFEGKLATQSALTSRVEQDLVAARERAADYLETLSSQEGRRSVFEDLLLTLGDDVEQRDGNITQLQSENTAHSARIRELETELRERVARITALEAQVNALTAALAQRTEQHTDVERASESLQQTLNALNGTLAERNERIKALEGTVAQQNTSAAQLNGQLERATAERTQLLAGAASLETSLRSATARGDQQEAAVRTAQARIEDLEGTLPVQRRRIEQLEAEMSVVRGELQASNTSLQSAGTERSEHLARLVASDARIAEMEAKIAEQQETVRKLQADSNANAARVNELESDLHSALETVDKLDGQNREKAARVEELEKTNEEWRATVEEARHAIADRDGLIERLEQETAASAVLVGHIQRSITRLDNGAQAGPNGLSGPNGSTPANGSNGATSIRGGGGGEHHHHEPAADGATRLLIRTDGDTEVVHVLGRKTTVGRTPDNDLQIDAKFISRHHAVILAGPAHAIIEDLNSTNGVMVNSRRISRQPLKDGDVVMVGKTQFRFVVRAARSNA